MTDSISLKELTIGYRPAQSVATDLSATLRSGELTCLLGANGVGKSTLLKTLSGYLPALSGEVILHQDEQRIPLSHMRTTTDRRHQLARMVSIVLSGSHVVENLTVRELVSLGRTPYTNFWGTLREEDRHIVDEALALVGITALAPRDMQSLSDGERQKAMIAKALAQHTPIILLDEPTAFLDFRSRIEMLRLLQRLAHEEQKTILLSTHDVELALQLGDTFWLMEAGHPLTIGTVATLTGSGALYRYIGKENAKYLALPAADN